MEMIIGGAFQGKSALAEKDHPKLLGCCQARRVMSRSCGAKAVPLVRIGRYPPYTEGIYGAEQKDLRGCNRQLRKFQP